MVFDRKEWSKKVLEPHWYLGVPDLMKQMVSLHDKDRTQYEKIKEEIYSFIEEKLNADQVSLGSSGKNFDAERKPVDTIVIHHTSCPPGLTKERLSAMELVRLYAPQYASPTYDADRDVKNKPIYSGHFREGKQVFWPYHWLIRKGGAAVRLLNDDEIGWHAGNWDVNCRSIAISFDNDYENSEPSEVEIMAVAGLLAEKYPNVQPESILGHCEINKKTSCPSTLFLGESGWKQKLIRARIKL